MIPGAVILDKLGHYTDMILDNSCKKYCDFIGLDEVTICDSDLHDFDSHLQLCALKCY